MNNNKLIAEFIAPLGLRTRDGGYMPENEMRYDTSWDWLMPVVEKIEQVNEGVPEQMLHVNLYSERREVYHAVVEFIKQYNDER